MKGPAVGYACSTVLAVLGCLAVVLGAPWPLVILAQSLVLALFFGFGALRIHLKHCKPAQAVSAPDPGQLANDAQAARRHALEYGLPTDPWTQLEGFWTAAGDLPLVIDDIEPAPVTEAATTWAEHAEERAARAVATAEDLDRETARLEREIEEPFDLDAFVERTRRRYKKPALQREAHRARSRQQELQPVRSGRLRGSVRIVNGAGEVCATYPDTDPTVRCTWTLTGTPEDDHVIRALRDAGVHVAIESTDVKTAHLAGQQSAIDAAKRAYTDGWRQRRARTGVGPPPGTSRPTLGTPRRSLAASKRPTRASTPDDATQQHLQTMQLFF